MSLLMLLAGCGPSNMQKTDIYSQLGPFLEPSIQADRQNPREINRSDFILTFNFTIDALLYKKSATCRINDLPPVDCPNGTFVLTDIPDGDHSITVNATDSLGRRAQDLTTSIRVDTVPPAAEITLRPGNFTGRMVNVGFTASDAHTGVAGTECALNGAAFTTCTSPLTLSNLNNGNHMIRIRARDRAGNISAENIARWTVNNGAAVIVVGNRPPDNTRSRSAAFSFTGSLDEVAVTQFRCSLNNANFTDCTSPITLAGLADGSHNFRIAGRNHNGEYINPTTVTWRVDNLPPTAPTIVTTLPPISNVATAQFMFSAADSGSGVAAFECSLDGQAFSSCMSPANYSNLAEGDHSFAVRAYDRAGNVSLPAMFNWTVDLP